MLAVSKVLRSGGCSVLQRRAFRVSNVISGPPTVRLPFAEKLAHGLTIAVGLLATPAYILGQLRTYTAK